MPRPPIPILTYHQVDTPPPRGTPYRSLVVSPGAFARQMGLLRLLGYRGLSMSALAPYLSGEQQGRVVGLTFDDGYVNNLRHALPVLLEHGFSATCYIVSGQLGGSNVWDLPKGVPPSPLMDVNHLRDWVAGGQEIGAHTRNHVDLQTVGDATAREEITACKVDLEPFLGVELRQFCYPYGHYRPEHAAMVREAGYTAATTTRRGRSAAADDAFALPRVPVHQSTTLPLFWAKIATAYEDRRRTA
ncbi:MAG: polysaccharide deacetylase family protein [Ramlibacter sp.]|nr:polysaccharide deacetylase family protein [Ramlibacter sp.]MCW5650846.1 polysaccharide deacetylase family protein [Ramlibacter sp.]